MVRSKDKAKPEECSEVENDANNRDFVTAVARGFAILCCFRRGERALGNKDIASRTGLAKSTVARLTYTLTKLGYLEFLPGQEKYALGIGVLTFGQTYLAGLDVRAAARPMMQELADYARATVALGAHYGLDMVFLELCHGSQMFLMRTSIGERVPHGSTALGRAYLAALSPEERAKFAASYSKLVKKEEWPTLRESSAQAIRDYEKYGFVLSLGDWNKEVYAVGTPMISADRTKILAFSCNGPVHEMTRKRLLSDIGPRLLALRDRVYDRLGGVF